MMQQQQQESGLPVHSWTPAPKPDQQQQQQQPPWYGRSFLQENDIIARALQVELSSPWLKSSADIAAAATASSSSETKIASSSKPAEFGLHSPSNGSIIPDWMRQKPVSLSMSAAAGVVGGKVNKRRSRAANKTPITFLSADASNFRAMVQKLTGIPASPVPLIMQQQQQGAIKNELRFWSNNSNNLPLPPMYSMQPPLFPQSAVDSSWQLNPNPSKVTGESLVIPTPSWPPPAPSTYANGMLVPDMAMAASWADGSMARRKIELAHSA